MLLKTRLNAGNFGPNGPWIPVVNEIMGGPEKGRLSFMNNINYSLVLVRWHLGIFERLRVWLLVG